jgi:hypothetical protein
VKFEVVVVNLGVKKELDVLEQVQTVHHLWKGGGVIFGPKPKKLL